MLATYVRGLSALVVVLGLMSQANSAAVLAADKDAAATPDAKADARAKTDKRKGDAVKGRLPAHYADLVDGEQRTKIYAIQAEHDTEITQLQTALKAAIAKRDAAVAAVLTPAQQEKLAKLQAEDMTKKGKRGAETKDGKTAAAAIEAAASTKTPASDDKAK